MKKQIVEMVKKGVAAAFEVQGFEPEVTPPANPEHGDFTTNAALVLASLLKAKPRDVALGLKNNLSDPEGLLEGVEIAGPGFLNFKIKPAKWIEALKAVSDQKERFGFSAEQSVRRAVVEFVSANPTGPLHIGNARGGPLGDAVAGLLATRGYKVTREFYVNDVGGQIDELGKTMMGHLKGEKTEGGYKGDYVKELAMLAGGEKVPHDPHALGEFGVRQMMEEIRKDCDVMGIRFDSWIHEKEVLGSGETARILGELKKRKVVVEKEGATWFVPKEGETGDDRESVLERSDGGRPTYFANDIAYHVGKFIRGFDWIINVWGSNHHGHVPRLKAALNALGFDAEKLRVVLYQYVRVKRGNEVAKMSKRGGDFVIAREVLDEVGKDAFRFFLLQRSPEAHLDFDLELAKKQSADNPVYYIQYAHARICSVFRKGIEEGKYDGKTIAYHQSFPSLLELPEEIDLARLILGYEEVLRKAAEDLAPHRITHYLVDLARAFQSYYDKARGDDRYRVLGAPPDSMKAKLFLLDCLRQVLQNALSLLGISAPERM